MPDESVRRRITYTDCHCDGYSTECHADGNCYLYVNACGKCDADGNGYSNADACGFAESESYSDGQTSADSAPEALTAVNSRKSIA